MQILTDFAGVLVGGLADFSKTVSARVGLPVGLFHGYLELSAPQRWQLHRGRVSEGEFWDAIASGFKQATKQSDGSLNGKVLRDIFYENMRQPVPGTLDVFRRIMYYPLRVGQGGQVGKGMPKIGIVSDSIAEMVPLFHEWHPEIFSMVEKEYWSCFHDNIKSDPSFFKFLLKGLGGEPSEYLLVDGEQRNVDQASLLGIPAIRFENAEKLERQMVDLGFVFYPKVA